MIKILVLLDTNLKRVGNIDPRSDKNFFWGEQIKRQIAEDQSSNDTITGLDTFNKTDPNANSKSWGDEITGLTMLQDSPNAQYLKIGYHIAIHDSTKDRWRVYRIITSDESFDDLTGRHIVTVDAVNLAIWKLGKNIPAKKDLPAANLKIALEWIMAGTGWDTDNNSQSGLIVPFSFDGSTSSQNYLQQVLTSFDCEADAYVHIDAAGIVDNLILEITDHIGSDEANKTVRYGHNMKGIHRQTVDTTLVTKLYVYGAGGESISSVNNGKNFITDTQANALYNNDQNTWLEGTITSNGIKQPAGLLDWAEKQLRLYNHPRINYTVECGKQFKANLGDEVKIIDTVMQPELTVQARVIQVNESLSNPNETTIVLGEFATVKVVTPNFIRSLEERYNDHIRQLFEEAKRNFNSASISLITPLGRSWYNSKETKKVIARLFIKGENVTSYLSPSCFRWQKINLDGTHDTVWENEHEDDGYEVVIEYPFVGTLLVHIVDDYVKNEAEIWIDTSKNNADESFKKLFETKKGQNFCGDTHFGGLQCTILLKNGGAIGSYAYKGKGSSKAYGHPNTVDTEFIRYGSDGNLLDSMVLQGGGHGSSFSYDESTNTIYTICSDIENTEHWIGTIQYQPNTKQSLNSMNKWCKVDKFVRPTFDLKHKYMLASHISGDVILCMFEDLQNNNYKPLIQFKVQDFNIKPSGNDGCIDGTTNTLQSNGLNYPFAFFTSGDANNKDEKIILAVNLITQSQEFKFSVEPNADIKLEVPLAAGGHLEPEGVYYDADNQCLNVGFNISRWDDETHMRIHPASAVYRFPLGFRDDTADLDVKYPADESNVIPADEIYDADRDYARDDTENMEDDGQEETEVEIDYTPTVDQEVTNNINNSIRQAEHYQYSADKKTQETIHQIEIDGMKQQAEDYLDYIDIDNTLSTIAEKTSAHRRRKKRGR